MSRFGTPDWPRFFKYVEKRDGCWIWIGGRRGNGRNEYGAFWVNGAQRAHIVSYVWTYGEPNADLHHTCPNALCVNPDHVTPAASGQPRHRNANPSLCARGHEFTPEIPTSTRAVSVSVGSACGRLPLDIGRQIGTGCSQSVGRIVCLSSTSLVLVLPAGRSDRKSVV